MHSRVLPSIMIIYLVYICALVIYETICAKSFYAVFVLLFPFWPIYSSASVLVIYFRIYRRDITSTHSDSEESLNISFRKESLDENEIDLP